ncbi:dsDNA-specific endonuclease/ATPase MutS2 [Alkalibacterium subtropicum]|uniref:DsDNA-specific endonuclease/ATPase MutS2 n=1 Tax=Alkalibacterium subtropicum TaxID=753702 RepID=A0A1I1HKL4_9LACT|nr:hypothetical protein [Alkalibacterium subtropicum]SFC24391.1 dsDNA-specific endonuclease/ATPase MutS2 [Alkalibacterium subtropicum]
MENNTFEMLEYTRILEQVSREASTEKAKQVIKKSQPLFNKQQLERMFEENREAVAILKKSASVPIYPLSGIEHFLQQSHKGLALRVDQLSEVLSFLRHCQKLKQFMKDKESLAPIIATYVWSIADLTELESELEGSLNHGQIDDQATPELAKTRRLIRKKQTEAREKAESLARSPRLKTYLQESHVIEKNGNYALQIKREFQNKIEGTAVDVSSSGATVFIMPKTVETVIQELDLLRISEENIVQQILHTLTGMILEKENEITIAVETMLYYDVLFAKAKYGLVIGGTIPELNENHTLTLNNARHPLLGSNAVPLSFCLNRADRALIITGPNTGGKTVTLKTLGLLVLMAQTGLMIPAEKGTSLHLFSRVYVDMGDGQSMDENLSTFSSRLKNIIHILEEANDNTLVLLDELGSGTDPREGMALAQIIMEQLVNKGAALLATTHYSELKRLAQKKSGFLNGSMEFDVESLQPTYRLLLGEAGDSQAFPIAMKLGMHPKLVQKAHELTYETTGKQYHYEEKEQFKRSYQKQLAVDRYFKTKKKVKQQKEWILFSQGDNVKISPDNEKGIIYQGPDAKGDYIVQVKNNKKTINHKRLTLHIKAEELYPADYDFDIVFKSKDYRKKKHLMGRKYVENLTIKEEEDK